MENKYILGFYSFSNKHPLLSKIIKQVLFWLLAYGLLFIIIHYTALSVVSALGRSIDIPVKRLLIIFLSFGLFLGISLGLIDNFLKNYSFRNRSLGFNILVGSVLYFMVLTILMAAIRYVALEFLHDYILNFAGDVMRINWKFQNIIILSYTLFMTLILSFLKQMQNKFGPGLILPFILGKFKYPKEENRIFMFLDLKNSTQLAEKIGHIQYSAFIQESFMDINQIVKKFNAQIYQYVGDEVIVSWPLRHFETSRAIDFYFEVGERFESRRDFYMNAFNHVPVFKAGVHQGLVTAVEVGDIKREIAYHGDTLNVTSRIESLCKSFDKLLLISAEVNKNKNIADKFNVNALGTQSLEGRERSIDIFWVDKK